MKIVIEFDCSGTHQEYPWGAPVMHRKGELHEVSPLHAVHLIKNHQAHLFSIETRSKH